MSKRKITDINLYDLLGILANATESDIKKAYRKKALQCHPDKNPDNPKAHELFLQLCDALEILTDAKAREAYDKTLKAKQLAKQRLDVLDAKRRKFREDLDRREREAKESGSKSRVYDSVSDEQRLQNEISRLKKEGSRILMEEQEYVREQLRSKTGPYSTASASSSSSRQEASAQASNVPKNPTQSFEEFEEFEAMVLRKLAAAAKAQKQDQGGPSGPV